MLLRNLDLSQDLLKFLFFHGCLTKQKTDIPVPADWMITMVEPIDKLKEMYIEDIVEYGKLKMDCLSTDNDSSDSVVNCRGC